MQIPVTADLQGERFCLSKTKTKKPYPASWINDFGIRENSNNFINYKITIMNRKHFKTFVLFFISTILFISGCDKNEMVSAEDINLKECQNEFSERLMQEEKIYNLNNSLVSREEINFENDELMLIHGVTKNKNEVLVFESRIDFYAWAGKQKNEFTQRLVKAVKDVDMARDYAEKLGEFERKETSQEFLTYLEDNFSDANRIGLGKLYEDFNRTGWSYLMGSLPIPRLSSKYNNAASSIEVYGRWYMLYERTYWRGYLEGYGYMGWTWWNLEKANNKTSSVWTI